MADTQEHRLSVRITQDDRERFEAARRAEHSRTLTDWILRHLHRAADHALTDRAA